MGGTFRGFGGTLRGFVAVFAFQPRALGCVRILNFRRVASQAGIKTLVVVKKGSGDRIVSLDIVHSFRANAALAAVARPEYAV